MTNIKTPNSPLSLLLFQVVPKAFRHVPSVLSEHSLECIAEADLPDWNALDDVDVLPSSETLSPSADAVVLFRVV